MKNRFTFFVRKWFVTVILGLVALLAIISAYRLQKGLVTSINDTIAYDIAQLNALFNTIHTDVGILGFDEQYNAINFLNVGQRGFVGDTVGAMKIARPDDWQGPYRATTLKIQEIPYAIVKNKDGYFITPGRGVVLHNGKIVGKDISLDEDENLESLALCENVLCHHGKPLVAKIQASPGMQPLTNQFLLASH